MSSIKIVAESVFASDTNAYQVDQGDNLIVNEGVRLSAQAPSAGIVAVGQNKITLNGSASGYTGVDSIDDLRLTIGESGRASGESYGVSVQSGGFINNHGTILGVASGLQLEGSSYVINTGRIISIDSQSAIGALGSGVFHINNSGLIKGPSIGGPSYESSLNAVDYLTNTGTMIGEVLFNDGNDVYNGKAGHVRGAIHGGGGNDSIMAGTEANRISGGEGLDRLSGETGNDTFIFDTSLNGRTNRDHIKDFANVKGNNDHFELVSTEPGTFTQLHSGQLSSDEFALVTSSKQTVGDDAHILYDKAHGALYYDSNGGDASGRITFAVLDNHATLTSADFFVV